MKINANAVGNYYFEVRHSGIGFPVISSQSTRPIYSKSISSLPLVLNEYGFAAHEGTNSSITEAEDRISEVEDRMVEINEREEKRKKN